MSTWDEDLPEVTGWQPRAANHGTLGNSLMVTCQIAQARILARAEAEVRFNLDNFDSGVGVEDIVREELADLLPARYAVAPGVVSDRRGRTAGDCDLLVRDHIWSPIIKLGATGGSRRFHFPIEGIYAAAEIKQTLGLKDLDAVMAKLVTLSRLERPDNPYGHITENQHLQFLDRPEAILNPLHTTVFATRLRDDTTFDDVVHRFGAINARLNRSHMVKMLCILSHGTAWYSVESGSPYNATHMTDRQEPLILQINHGEPANSFYRFFMEILGHLTRSVLRLTDVASDYGEPPPTSDIRRFDGAAFNPPSS